LFLASVYLKKSQEYFKIERVHYACFCTLFISMSTDPVTIVIPFEDTTRGSYRRTNEQPRWFNLCKVSGTYEQPDCDLIKNERGLFIGEVVGHSQLFFHQRQIQ
jgi:hypothetical protein